jgi:hypothetical protein
MREHGKLNNCFQKNQNQNHHNKIFCLHLKIGTKTLTCFEVICQIKNVLDFTAGRQ